MGDTLFIFLRFVHFLVPIIIALLVAILVSLLSRVLKMSGHNWVRSIGLFIIFLSALSIAATFIKMPELSSGFSGGIMIALLSEVLAVYSFGQWLTRRLRFQSSLRAGFRQPFIFLKKNHQFIGWLVTITAFAHVICFAPFFTNLSSNILLTGCIDLALLFILVGFGFVTDRSIHQGINSKRLRLFHMCLAFCFIVVLLMHVVFV